MADQFIGRRVNLGVGRETTRGIAVAPTFWIPRTSLTFNDKVNKHIEEESLGVIDDSDAAFVTERWGEGDIEAEIRDKSFGLFLYSMLGTVSSVVKETTAYNHTFTLSETNLHQSLTFSISDPIGNVRFPLVMLNSLTLTVEVGGVAKFSSSWLSRPSDTWAAVTETYSVENKFRATDLIFKLAPTRTDLAATSEIPIKSLSITFNKNLLRSMVLGTVEPDDIFNQQLGIEGTITLDYENRTYRDYMINGTYRALSIDLLNSGVTIGASSNPQLQIILPRVHFFDWESTTALNEISIQTVNFKALRDVANNEDCIYQAILTNEQVSY